MPRDALWVSIAGALREEIAQGLYRPGDKLPTEAGLSARFGVNRHTVRHALAALAKAGSVHPRRGSGVYVTARPTEYALGRRVRFHQNVAASGRAPSRRITRLETRPCGGEEAEALQLAAGAMVHVVEGISLADGQPLATFRSVFPAARFPGLLAAMEGQSSVTAALAACGLTDYTRADTRLTARLADPVLALALQVQPAAPVLRSVAVNVDGAGVPVEYGTTWFAGDRVTLTVNPDQA
ncbi:phosphonate metabolism transcriptional regulator PhnF [Rhodobacter sp. Har01]|uniref:phosphonate metabolism transcriptional regulator PhnF n=1 Tax=Rhodobacter sp. Har01 TaxID=2883999 RepID=UPI001D0699CE|nr:phosphonate metabolism transcriptional regulator PhnF [Rhodobacter sp. Har01]MCB6179773.1 phosphonate metabolism transcriptional regulator PhnF [Rhodobacter sp. Har01]